MAGNSNQERLHTVALLSRDVTHLLDPNIEKTTNQPEGLPILFLLVGKKKAKSF
jgi:hypothetical protein